MSRRDKLEAAARRSPANFPFDDLCRLVEKLGFELDRQSSSHRIYRHPYDPAAFLNLQRGPNGQAKVYQVQQVLDYIDSQHGDDDAAGDGEEVEARARAAARASGPSRY